MIDHTSNVLFQQALNIALKESFRQIQLPSTSVINASWDAVYQKLESEFKQIAMN